MPRPLLVLTLAFLLAITRPAQAQQAQPGATEAKLREGLRNTMLQLRAMQGERDQLLVEKTTLDAEKKDLTEKLEALTKQAAANQDTAQKTVAALETKLATLDTELAQHKAALEKWQAAQKEAAALAAKKESERATAVARIIELGRQVADQQRKNAAMYKIGSEVLNRYEKFVLGDALAAREPFTGIARVKFQTLAQDFQDQLTDQRIIPPTPPAPPTPAGEKAPATKTKIQTKPANPTPKATASNP